MNDSDPGIVELLAAAIAAIGALFCIALPIFCVWLAVRIKRRREEWAIALAWLIGVFGVMVVIVMLIPIG